MSDGYHLSEDYQLGYRHGWVEAIGMALDVVDAGGRAEKALRQLLDEARLP